MSAVRLRRLPAMAVTSKNVRSVQPAPRPRPLLVQRLHTAAYAITLLLAALALYAALSLLLGRLHTTLDDLRYGRPRPSQLDAFVGHDETAGHPPHLMAINLNRQVV